MRSYAYGLIAIIGATALAGAAPAEESGAGKRPPHRDSHSNSPGKTKHPGGDFTGMAPPIFPAPRAVPTLTGSRPAEGAERAPSSKAAGAQSASAGPRTYGRDAAGNGAAKEPIPVAPAEPGRTAAEEAEAKAAQVDAERKAHPYRFFTPASAAEAQPSGGAGQRPAGASAPGATGAPRIYAADGTYLGRLSNDPYDPESVSNPFGKYGTPYGNTITNPHGKYGSPYSAASANNPHATQAPSIYSADGRYLGKLSENEFDPESTANPHGRYGSPYGDTVTNPYSAAGRSVKEPAASGRSTGKPAQGISGDAEQPASYARRTAPETKAAGRASERSKPSGGFTPYRTPAPPAAPSGGSGAPTFTTPAFKAPGSTTKPGAGVGVSPTYVNPFTFKPKSLAERK